MAEKKIDESWKESVHKEKGGAEPKAPLRPEEPAPSPASPVSEAPESNFSFFISTLGMQALAALGLLPDPSTGLEKTAVSAQDLAHAKYLIDIIQMLSEKTKGNLTPKESSMIEDMLYELRVKFVEKNRVP